MANWSSEFKKFKLSGLCPSCKKLNLAMAIHSDSGDLMPFFTPIWVYKPGWYAVCKKCGQRIEIFEGSKILEPEVLELLETNRSEEFIGREERLIDNIEGQSEVSRKFRVQREWSRTLKVEKEESFSQEFGIPELGLAIQDALKKRYSVSEAQREVYLEEVAITVPAGAKVRVVFDWKRIWQHGSVVIRVAHSVHRSKFAVVAGVTFDQQQLSA